MRSHNLQSYWNQKLAIQRPPARRSRITACYNGDFGLESIIFIHPPYSSVVVRVFFLSRSDAAVEVLALRQQVSVRKRKRPRPVLNSWDRFFWTTPHRF